ncbi:unnamed protein product [Blepharisma stoltei]|uniref:USP domain-containing protein n=1 Tax=Blepharisma stoltei TaxID=1481888 RepID=A0AAU9JNH5_9CILI|nr:unnamed protein product [Blepharisma stoltei]
MQGNFQSTAQADSTAQGFINNDTDCFIISALQLCIRSGLLRTICNQKWKTDFLDSVNPIVDALIDLRNEYNAKRGSENRPLKVQRLRMALADQKTIYQCGNLGDAWDAINFMFETIHNYYSPFFANRIEACCPVHEIFGKVGKQVESCTNPACDVPKNPKIYDIDKRAYIIQHTVQIINQENMLVPLGIINKGENEDLISFMLSEMENNAPRRCLICHETSYKKAYFFSEFPKYLLLYLDFNNSIPNLPDAIYSNFEKLQSIPCGAFWYNAVGFILYVKNIHYTAMIYSRAKKVWQVIDDQKKILLEDYSDLRESVPSIALYRLSNKQSNYHFPILFRYADLPIEPNYISPPDSVNLEQKSIYVPTKQLVDHKICLACNMPNPIYNSVCISCKVNLNNPISS